MPMAKPRFTADKDFVKWPFLFCHSCFLSLLRPTLRRGGCLRLLRRIGPGRFTNPGTIVMCLAPLGHACFIARPVTGNHVKKFLPVDIRMLVMSRFLILAQLFIWNGKAEEVRLRHRYVNELLSQFIVAKTLNLPGHGLRGMF